MFRKFSTGVHLSKREFRMQISMSTRHSLHPVQKVQAGVEKRGHLYTHIGREQSERNQRMHTPTSLASLLNNRDQQCMWKVKSKRAKKRENERSSGHCLQREILIRQGFLWRNCSPDSSNAFMPVWHNQRLSVSQYQRCMNVMRNKKTTVSRRCSILKSRWTSSKPNWTLFKAT